MASRMARAIRPKRPARCKCILIVVSIRHPGTAPQVLVNIPGLTAFSLAAKCRGHAAPNSPEAKEKLRADGKKDLQTLGSRGTSRNGSALVCVSLRTEQSKSMNSLKTGQEEE